jgi:hypothetical protein
MVNQHVCSDYAVSTFAESLPLYPRSHQSNCFGREAHEQAVQPRIYGVTVAVSLGVGTHQKSCECLTRSVLAVASSLVAAQKMRKNRLRKAYTFLINQKCAVKKFCRPVQSLRCRS